MKRPSISILLPRRESFSAFGAGAVALVIQTMAAQSRYRDSLCVLGPKVESPLSVCRFLPVEKGPFWLGSSTRRYLHQAKQLMSEHHDIIEIHNRPEYIATIRKRFPTASILLYLHNDPRTMKKTKTIKERQHLLNSIDAIVCVSDYIRQCFCDGLTDPNQKVAVVLNAIDRERLRTAPLEEKKKEIIFMGRMIPDKGPHLLAEAVLKILPDYPDWKVVFVGSRYFGSNARESYEEQLFASLKPLGDQVEITGYLPRDEGFARLGQASIAVLPSLWDEPAGLVPIEAMAAGCAIITTKRGGISEHTGPAALYLEHETVEELICLLEPLLRDEQALRAQQETSCVHARDSLPSHKSSALLDAIRQKAWEQPKQKSLLNRRD